MISDRETGVLKYSQGYDMCLEIIAIDTIIGTGQTMAATVFGGDVLVGVTTPPLA